MNAITEQVMGSVAWIILRASPFYEKLETRNHMITPPTHFSNRLYIP